MAGQVWLTDSLGGYMWSPNLSNVLRTAVQPLAKYRQFCDADGDSAFGKGKGDTYHWNVYGNIATQGTVLVETNTVPESNFTITQGTGTVQEYANSVPVTGKLEMLSEHSLMEVVKKTLKNDCRKALDTAAFDQFNLTPLRVEALGGTSSSAITLTTNSAAASTNTVALNKEHIKLISDQMKERDIPPYAEDSYFCIARPSTYRTFKNDLESINQYTQEGLRYIMYGEIGRYEGIRFVEQTQIASAGWDGGVSDQAFFFGEDTVREAIVVPEEVRGAIPSDYGRKKGMAWLH